MSSAPDFYSTANIVTLKQRSQLMRSLRDFFHAEGYWEVETPLLSQETCIDAWIDPYPVIVDGDSPPWYLQTSPEFAMKRLLTSGADSIYQFTHSFRSGEQGARHNHEFCILEWYRVGVDHHDQMTFVEMLLRQVVETAVRLGLKPASDLPQPIPRLKYDDAFQNFCGTKVLHLNSDQLLLLAQGHRLSIPPGLHDDKDGLLNLLLAEVVEPGLEKMGGVFLFDYPDSQSALARINPGPPPVAERFELYLSGIELCNGYHELTDSVELRDRFERQNRLRLRAGKPAFPVDSRFLAAMASGLPASSGVALGVDRLLMWALNLSTMADVIPFPMDRA